MLQYKHGLLAISFMALKNQLQTETGVRMRPVFVYTLSIMLRHPKINWYSGMFSIIKHK